MDLVQVEPHQAEQLAGSVTLFCKFSYPACAALCAGGGWQGSPSNPGKIYISPNSTLHNDEIFVKKHETAV